VTDPLSPEVEYSIPERSGEVLIVPPLDRIGDLLAANRALSWGGAEVLGTPLPEFRARARARALSLAAAYSEAPPPSPDRPLILMGHQPLFLHPGVWLKYFLLTRLCAVHRVGGLHLIVDTDATGPISAPLPAYQDRLMRVSETLRDIADDIPLEAVRPPTPEEWAGFCSRVRGRLSTLPGVRLEERVDALAESATQARAAARTLADFLAGVRRAYERRGGDLGYLEVPVSHLAGTSEFCAFALHVMMKPEELLRSYNGRLEEYRRLHRLRSAANPFPNLTQGSGRIEVPFWVIRAGQRTDVFASRTEGRLVLATADGPLTSVSPDLSGARSLAAAGLALRPKAMMLTMYARLCLGDLFIHGVSGGRYDRVTDAILMDLFGCPPPAYVVATATLHLPLPGEKEVAEERRLLERRLMDLRHNPDRHLEAISEAQRRLVNEKWALIRALEAMRPGPERRAATRRIREVNEQLAEALAPEIARMEARLASLQQVEDSEEVVRYRGYPFFLFDPAEVGALVAAPTCPA
jgi:hypothetical protein